MIKRAPRNKKTGISVFLRALPYLLICSSIGKSSAAAKNEGAKGNEIYLVQGPGVNLSSAPLLNAPPISLALVWGESLPIGSLFVAEKVYGRWAYGQLRPLKNMKKKDFAKPGWIYTRFLLSEHQEPAQSASFRQQLQNIYHYGKQVWKLQEVNQIKFLESTVISKEGMRNYQRSDEQNQAFNVPSYFPWKYNTAWAEDSVSLGLSGSSFEFLRQEISRKDHERYVAKQKVLANTLSPPKFPPINESILSGILGRYLLAKKFSFSPLTHFEIDGHLYMQSIALRTLQGCEKAVQDYWQNRNWTIFKVISSSDASPELWQFEILPGGIFAINARTIATAKSEAELAFLIARAFAQSYQLSPSSKNFSVGKDWQQKIESLAMEQWQKYRKTHFLSENETADVSVALQVNLSAAHCLGGAGFDPNASLSYMKRMKTEKTEPWAKNYFTAFMANDFLTGLFDSRLKQKIASQEIKSASTTNSKRYQESQRVWNVLP